jgi:hypothetical protein
LDYISSSLLLLHQATAAISILQRLVIFTPLSYFDSASAVFNGVRYVGLEFVGIANNTNEGNLD